MTLLLVGIVAVILVILAAAFLTLRRGQDDDQDEPGGRWAVRDRVRSAGRDGHWRGQAQDIRRTPRRPERAESSRRPEERPRGYDDPGPAHAGRRSGRDPRNQHSDRGYPARAPGRYADTPAAPEHSASSARGTRGSAAAARRPAGRRHPDGYDTASCDTGPGGQLYDTGPSAAMDEHPSLPGGQGFTVDHEDDSALTDSDVFPRVRTDIPAAIPAAKTSKPQAPAKSRSRQSRSKRGDDNDWPSTEWDKLSDEQYWAELSSDKPLATTARTAQPSAAKAAPAPSSPPQAKPAQAKPAQARSAAANPARQAPAPSAPAKPSPDRESVTPRRRDRHKEAATEALPIRSRPRPDAAQPAPPREAGEPSLAVLTSLASAPETRQPESAPRDDDPLTSPSFSRQAAPSQDSRSYRNAGRDRQSGNTGDYPTVSYPAGSYANGNYANGSGAQRYQASASEHTNPQAAAPAASSLDDHRPAPQQAPQQPVSPRVPAGNPYGSYVDRAPAAHTGSPAAGYPTEDRMRTEVYGDYSAAAGYPEPLLRQSTGHDPAVGLPGQNNGWHSAPPPAAPEFPTDPASQYLFTGGSGYPDTAGYGTGFPADASYQGGYAEPGGYPEPAGYMEPAGYPESAGYMEPTGYPQPAPYQEPAGHAEGAHNGARHGYGTDPYGPDGYGGYRPRQA